ncbi:hypothetical protein HPB50_029295 [Hyalomma asiaticum]|nr:hypothetical protein HPB50_029295 [Hyalomma asiaticum]
MEPEVQPATSVAAVLVEASSRKCPGSRWMAPNLGVAMKYGITYWHSSAVVARQPSSSSVFQHRRLIDGPKAFFYYR